MKILLKSGLILLLILSCKKVETDPLKNNNSNASEKKTSAYRFELGKPLDNFIYTFISKKQSLDKFDLCVELNEDKKVLSLIYAEAENDAGKVSIPFTKENGDIYIASNGKGSIYFRKVFEEGFERLYISLAREFIDNLENLKKAENAKKYGIIYEDGVLEGESLEDCLMRASTKRSFEKEQDTFSKEMKEHGPWGSEEGTKKEK